jgi:hypothetical protein
MGFEYCPLCLRVELEWRMTALLYLQRVHLDLKKNLGARAANMKGLFDHFTAHRECAGLFDHYSIHGYTVISRHNATRALRFYFIFPCISTDRIKASMHVHGSNKDLPHVNGSNECPRLFDRVIRPFHVSQRPALFTSIF